MPLITTVTSTLASTIFYANQPKVFPAPQPIRSQIEQPQTKERTPGSGRRAVCGLNIRC
jgi:hypothetical protein